MLCYLYIYIIIIIIIFGSLKANMCIQYSWHKLNKSPHYIMTPKGTSSKQHNAQIYTSI